MARLVLGRKVGERIFIGHDIVLTVVEAKGGRARLVLDAPKDVDIQREELLKAGDPRLARAEAK